MTPPSPSTDLLPDVAAQRQRARERVYVVCQCFAWLLMLGMQVFLAVGLGQQRSREKMIESIAMIVVVILLGWLITHFSRLLVHRLGWKQLGWRPLVPRVLGLSLGQSLIWSAIGFTYSCLVLPPQQQPGTPLPLLMVVSVVNGTVIFIGWWCVYFCYHLFDRFNTLHIEQLRLAAEVKDAELRALKSQVNPHFIFNALNSLRALIDEDPARARQAVTQLANLLRYSLQSAHAETVPFEDELRVVNDYLALEQVRHEERLRVRLQVDPDTLGQPIPPLVLQTLVENAVKYGISPRADGGEVAILARQEGGAFRLQVWNPGRLAGRRDGGPSTGLGLRNAAERLRLSCGAGATLTLRDADDNRVVSEVVIPSAVPAGPTTALSLS